MNPEIESRIRSLAHQFWEEEGRPQGKEQEHWRRACEQLEGGNSGQEPGSREGRGAGPTSAGRRVSHGAEGMEGDPDGAQSGQTKEDVFLKAAIRRTPD